MGFGQTQDEIQQYLDAHYVSALEAHGSFSDIKCMKSFQMLFDCLYILKMHSLLSSMIKTILWIL